ERLEGIYKEYEKFLKEEGLSSKAGDPNKVLNEGKIKDTYFPFLKLAINKGSNANITDAEGFGNGISNKKISLSDPNDVKLSGLIWVGNKLQAVTGNNNNLYFSGAVIVGKNNNGELGIRGVRNTTFTFDDSVLDLLESIEAPSYMTPVLYKQYDRVYDR
ncbi:MAG: hypothetical protein ACK4GR_00085, partial [bacterium]